MELIMIPRRLSIKTERRIATKTDTSINTFTAPSHTMASKPGQDFRSSNQIDKRYTPKKAAKRYLEIGCAD